MLGACASDNASQKELTELRAELRAMRQSNERMEKRLTRLEEQQVVASVKKRSPSKVQEADQPWSGESVPELTVVKMTPRRDKAPPLETRTEVQEPPEEQLEALLETSAQDAAAQSESSAEAQAQHNLGEAAFEQAMSALKTGNVSGAVLMLQSFAEEYPRHARADNALYFSGIGLLGLDDVDGAMRAFQSVLAEYPAGDARIDSLLKLADCRLKLNQKDDARALYAKLISTYPGTEAASLAQQRLAQLTQ